MDGWLGVDFDGTLAVYDTWQGLDHLGEPVPAMVERVKGWLAEGRAVRIVTARVSHDGSPEQQATAIFSRQLIEAWCRQHLGRVLPVTCAKDFAMLTLYDDRCVQVEANTGRLITAE